MLFGSLEEIQFIDLASQEGGRLQTRKVTSAVTLMVSVAYRC